MPVCVVKLCKNNTTRNKKDTGITYHRFPADPILCERWSAIVRLSREETRWKPGNRSIICSAHFNESDLYITKGGLKRLCKEAVPRKALFLSSTPPENISDKTFTEPSLLLPVVSSNNTAATAEPSKKRAVINADNSAATTELSTSSVVNSDSSAINKDSTTTVPVVNSDNSAVPDDDELEDFPEFDCIYSPKMMKLKRELHKKNILQLKHARIIKTLREKVRRLKRANSNLKNIIKSKWKQFSDSDLYKVLQKVEVELYE